MSRLELGWTLNITAISDDVELPGVTAKNHLGIAQDIAVQILEKVWVIDQRFDLQDGSGEH